WLARLLIAEDSPFLRSHTRARVSPAATPKAASRVLPPTRQRAPATGIVLGSSWRTASSLPLVFHTGSRVASVRPVACACTPEATPRASSRASGSWNRRAFMAWLRPESVGEVPRVLGLGL